MFNLIPTFLFIVSLGGLVYIISNHLSELSGSDKENFSGGNEENKFLFGLGSKLADWVNRLPLNDVKSQSLSFTQKFLHRTRVLLLKADNGLMKIIGKIAEKETNGGYGKNSVGAGEEKDSDFWQDLSRGKQESEKIAPEPTSEVKIELTAEKNEKIEKFFDIKPAKKISRVKKSAK